MSQRRKLRLQFFARFEADSFAFGNGDLRTRTRVAPNAPFARLHDEYAKAAFAAAAGDTFVVASARGGYVVRVLERQTTTLAAATQQLRRSILQSQGNAAVQKVLTETSAALDIRVNPRFGGWDTTRLQVTLRTATGNNELSSPQAPPGGPSAPAQDPLPPQQ